MVDLQLRLHAFIKLGDFFREFCEYTNNETSNGQAHDLKFEEFDQNIKLAGHKNGWFTKDNVLFSIKNWGDLLTAKHLENWLSAYDLNQNSPKTVALIMAGNIPLVGFHDFLSVLLTGNTVLAKLSSNDNILLPFIANYLKWIDPTIENDIFFPEGRLKDFDAVIATGSDNTSRYFEYYFGKKPNIIRKSKNSVAVLTGRETQKELQALGEDVFRYYGLGCRSVSKLYVPEGYNFDTFFESIHHYKDIINQQKYANNYDYNKAVYLMSEFSILDNGFLVLKEDENYGSPIASIFYEQYTSLDDLKEKLAADQEKIQCVVASGVLKDDVPFGLTQQPCLMDYADGIDTVEFLLKI